MTAGSACTIAEHYLRRELPRRWFHVSGVAAVAAELSTALELPSDLVDAAWLHDVGYARRAWWTGFHPLDGARFLKRLPTTELVQSLVAYHSFAQVEAKLRGLEAELRSEFAFPPQEFADALCFADMTTGPGGDRVELSERLAEIRRRYGAGHVVTRFVDCAESEIVAAVGRVEGRLGASQSR